MKRLNFFLGLFCLISLAAGKPPIIDDAKIIRNFQTKSGEHVETGNYPSVAELQKQLAKPQGMPVIAEVSAPESPLNSVFVVGSVYDCGKCDQWHPSGIATAWVMASDGVFCTNYHVLKSFKGEGMTVASWKGEVYPITEILFADKENDVAVFRAKVKGLVPLPLAKKSAEVGAKISCLSHPKQRFFLRTFGEVARYHMKRARKDKVPQMAVTADYAQGSSGGPILNEKNEVVGMVSTTSSLYSTPKNEKQDERLQMVMKNCVPSFVMKELLLKEEVVVTEGAE